MRHLYVVGGCFVTSAFSLPGADNHSDRTASRPIVPIEKRRFAGKVEAAGIEPASAAAPAERLQA
jgi:hypothetical protein